MGIYGLRADIRTIEKKCPKWYKRKFHHTPESKAIDRFTSAEFRYTGWFRWNQDGY